MSSASQILERDTELARIAEALDAAAAGNGRALVIEGPAGIGKTRLVRETRELAGLRGFGRLQATGDETETSMSWGVVRQMVERSVSRYRGEIREAILAGPAGRALLTLDEAPHDSSDADLARTLHALWWVAIDLSADRPLLITVDDAQWADQPSLRFLGYLARRIADLPIALVVGTRPPSGGTGPLTEFTVSPHVERLLPAALSPEAVAGFHTPDGVQPCPEVAAAMHEACGGNPFLTGALLDELVSAGHDITRPATARAIGGLGPSTVSRAMLSRLSPPALQLAGAAAVLGTDASPWLARAVAQIGETALEDAVAELVRANVLVGGADGLTFVHPVIREATVAALGGLTVAGMHARAASEMSARGAPATQLAPHLLAAPVGTLADGADLLAQAASASLAAGDRDVAADFLGRAHEERPGDPELAVRYGQALLRAGRCEEALPILRTAADRATSSHERAGLLTQASQATFALHGAEQAVADLVAELAGWPDFSEDPARLVLEARLGLTRSFLPAQRRIAAEHLARFTELAGDTPEERVLLALLAQNGRYHGDPYTGVTDVARRALKQGALFDDTLHDGAVPWVLAMMSLLTGDGVAEARREIDRARGRVSRGGSPVDFAMVENCQLMLAWRSGDVPGTAASAEAILEAVRAEPARPDIVALRATATNMACYVDLELRDLDAARRHLAEFDATEQGPQMLPVIWLYEVRSRIALAADEPSVALRELDTLAAHLAAADVDPAHLAWRLPAALAHSRLGQNERATELMHEHLALARRWACSTELGQALRVGAKFVADPEEREAQLLEALSVLEVSPDRLERTKAIVDLAEINRTRGRRSESRELLVQAAALAEECGARAVSLRIAAALEALGDRPRRDIGVGADSLTASERRVAGLAVAGRSNRDIAQELFVSPKTVENHLGRIYTKLGIAGRRELAGALG